MLIVMGLRGLLLNSRFWILFAGLVVSINLAGLVQLFVAGSTLQTIRLEQVYGFVSMTLLYTAILASPLTKAYPDAAFVGPYLHARRAIGVLTFYFACLHVYLTFFDQLGGFSGVKYYNNVYTISLLCGAITTAIMGIMTLTSVDWAVKKMGFTRWKLLHRLIYVGSIALLVHVALIGPHYGNIGFISTLSAVAIVILLYLEFIRIRRRSSRV